MNNAIIKMDWQNVCTSVTRGIVESSSCLFDCLDGVLRATSDAVPAIEPCADDGHYDVTVTVVLYMPKTYDKPQDDVVKAAILADISNRMRSRIISAASRCHNFDINDGLKTTMLVDSWNTDQWGDIE